MSAVERAARRLAPMVSSDSDLGSRTTYRVGGAATALVEPTTEEDLAEVSAVLAETAAPTLIVGMGSNLLVADAGFEGIAIVLGESYAAIDIAGTGVQAGGMAALPVLARRTAAEGLTGLEWAVGVPGSVGGAVRMNAGGHGSDIAATLQDVDLLDLSTAERSRVVAADLGLAYRTSNIASHQLVVTASFELCPGDVEASQALIAEIVRWRRDHQPGGANAGSVFQNPTGDSAGRLIEVAGCKGLRLGTAQVSEKHANFFQSDEGGSADDVFRLMKVVAAKVRASAGVVLVPETRLVGFAPWEAP